MEPTFYHDVRRTLDRAARSLRALPEASASTPRAPGKWTPKEIIGHLIDSASNNHQRFIRAQFKGDLMFEGYAQDDWVRVQHYRTEEWHTLITLWESFNLHLIHAIEQIPEAILKEQRRVHNLDERAFKPVSKDTPATLEYFIIDYFDHMKHHLRQIFPDL